MLQVMIVEDDINYRYALRQIIDWEKYGYTITAEAIHGEEALRLLEHTPVDIILTDISMPRMDGVQLIREVSRQYPTIPVIVLSNYNDFAYVKDAMKYGAKDYLLKYEMLPAQVLAALEQVRQSLEQAVGMVRLEEFSRADTYYLVSTLLREFLLSDEKEPSPQMQRFFHLQQIHRRSPQLVLALVEGDCTVDTEVVQGFMEQEQSPLLYATLSERRLAVLLSLAEYRSTERIYQMLHRLSDVFLAKGNPNRNTVGISSIILGYQSLAAAYQQAEQALEHQLYQGVGSVYHYAQPVIDDKAQRQQSQRQVREAVAKRDTAQVEWMLESYYHLAKKQQISQECLQIFLTEILSKYYPTAADRERWQKPLDEARTLGEKKNILSRAIREQDRIKVLRSHYSHEIQQTIAYINRYYNHSLSAQDLAQRVNLSPNYLSTIFREQTGERLTEYMARVRIEKAVPLVLEERLKVYEIARQVGFENPSYFSTVFKQQTGLTVNEYRKKNKS